MKKGFKPTFSVRRIALSYWFFGGEFLWLQVAVVIKDSQDSLVLFLPIWPYGCHSWALLVFIVFFISSAPHIFKVEGMVILGCNGGQVGPKPPQPITKQVKPGFTNYQPRGLLFSQSNQIWSISKSKNQNFFKKNSKKINNFQNINFFLKFGEITNKK